MQHVEALLWTEKYWRAFVSSLWHTLVWLCPAHEGFKYNEDVCLFPPHSSKNRCPTHYLFAYFLLLLRQRLIPRIHFNTLFIDWALRRENIWIKHEFEMSAEWVVLELRARRSTLCGSGTGLDMCVVCHVVHCDFIVVSGGAALNWILLPHGK